MYFRSFFKVSLIVSSLILCFPWSAPLLYVYPEGSSHVPSLRGYPDSQVKTQLAWEEKLRAIPKPELLREYMKHLSAEPHHVGSEYGRQNAEYLLNKFREWELEAHIERFEVLFPTPKERFVEMLEPVKYRAQLKEPSIAEDPDSSDASQLPTYNVFSADGDVTAPLVYVNYGLPSDYEELARLNIDVRGKIVIARYGGSWRGIKVKMAHERGALGCLIYSDPQDDGYFQGDVYPEGPYRPEHGVQRGSVMDMPIHTGDPLTPGWGSIPGARRIAREESQVIMKIPVLPLSYADALPLLKALQGPVAPKTWRGALPITYHVGPGLARIRMKAEFDWSLHTLYNVVTRIEGHTYPDEWIIYGNHHDAWVNGASDPVSGMVTVMEVARALGELRHQGWKPKRTILLCAWDGEEPGLIGSTEWVEHHAQELKDKAVAYLNSDTTGKGWLRAGGSHTLEKFVNEVARDILEPAGKASIWQALKKERLEQAKTKEDKKELAERTDLRISALGAGSDYTPFIHHLGIASLNMGFGGESDAGDTGVYHSIYDSFNWYTRFSDTTFKYGCALAQFNGTLVMRMAGAEVLPFDFTNLADTVHSYIDDVEKLAKENLPPKPVALNSLKSAARTLSASANRYAQTYRKLNANSGRALLKIKRLKELNQLLYQSERRLTLDHGLPRRAWFKHHIYAPGLYTGYGVKTLPGIREAVEQKNWADVDPQIKNVRTALLALASQIDAATQILLDRQR